MSVPTGVDISVFTLCLLFVSWLPLSRLIGLCKCHPHVYSVSYIWLNTVTLRPRIVPLWSRRTAKKRHFSKAGVTFCTEPPCFHWLLTLFALYTQQVNSEPRFWKINLRGQTVFLQWAWDKQRRLAAETQPVWIFHPEFSEPVWQVYCSKGFLWQLSG